jgi:hypothetical protein
MKKYFLIVFSLLLSCQNIPSNNKIENEKQEKVRLSFLNKQDFSKMLTETKGLEKINKSKSLEIMNKYKNIGSNKIIINENVKPFLDKNVFNIKEEDSGECVYNSYCYDECIQHDDAYGGAVGSGCLIAIGHGCLICPEPPSGGSGGSGGDDNNNNTKDCSKVITPEELNNLISLLGNPLGFNIKADTQSSLISDLKEFTKIINQINKYENQIQEIIKTYHDDNDKKVRKIQAKLEEFSGPRYNTAGVINSKLDTLKYQAINILREANVLVDSAIGVDLTSTSSNPLAVYKDQIEILDSEFDFYVSNGNTYDLIQSSKILAKEILLNNEIITKYLDQNLKDLSLEENIDDDDIETPLDKLTKVSQVVRFFSRQVDNHKNKLIKEQNLLVTSFDKLALEIQDIIKDIDDFSKDTNTFNTTSFHTLAGQSIIEGLDYKKQGFAAISDSRIATQNSIISYGEFKNKAFERDINNVKNNTSLTAKQKSSEINQINMMRDDNNNEIKNAIKRKDKFIKDAEIMNERIQNAKNGFNDKCTSGQCNLKWGNPKRYSVIKPAQN